MAPELTQQSSLNANRLFTVAPQAAPQVYPAQASAGQGSQPGEYSVRRNGLAVASLVLGIVGIFVGFISIAAIIMSSIALHQVKKTGQQGKAFAAWGLALGIISLVLSIIATMVVIPDML